MNYSQAEILRDEVSWRTTITSRSGGYLNRNLRMSARLSILSLKLTLLLC